MNSAHAVPGSGFIGDEAPVAQRVSPSGARWGRAAMASFFVVGAAISVAIHEDAWTRIASSNASPLDWLYVISAGSGVVTGLLFSVGRATVGIASAWICYCLIEAVGAYPFWAVPPGVVAENATGFFSHLAVAASLMLYISVLSAASERKTAKDHCAMLSQERSRDSEASGEKLSVGRRPIIEAVVFVSRSVNSMR